MPLVGKAMGACGFGKVSSGFIWRMNSRGTAKSREMYHGWRKAVFCGVDLLVPNHSNVWGEGSYDKQLGA